MAYKITIEKTETTSSVERGDWTIVKEVPWTHETLVSENVYGSKEKFLERQPTERVYGYAPDAVKKNTTTIKVLEQTVETLDLAAVIKAVNAL